MSIEKLIYLEVSKRLVISREGRVLADHMQIIPKPTV
jgi:hypothetical protein